MQYPPAAVTVNTNLLSGVDHIQWIDSTSFIASQVTDTGRIDYVVSATDGKYTKLLESTDASELVVSPSKKKAAYTDSTGSIFIIDLGTGTKVTASTDVNIKPELVWSNDETGIYFLNSDKGTQIKKLDIATSTITTIEDGGDYKADLNVSADGKTIYYSMVTPPVVTTPTSDDVAIDASTAGTQLYMYNNDPSIKDNKAVKLTSSTDDKMYIHAAADGSGVTYLDVSPWGQTSLEWVGKDKTTKTLFVADNDVVEAMQVGSKWNVLVSGTDNQWVYNVDLVSGAIQQLYTLSSDVTDVKAAEGTPVAIIKDGKVSISKDGKWNEVTR